MPGEAKFIYSNADESESYRLDFMYGLGLCRMTVGKLHFANAVELTYEKEHLIKIVVKENLVQVYVDGMLIIDNHNLEKEVME